ncbi:glycoside hydrolase family 43 protein [Streptomyces sp. NBC_01016]|uniref:glycoside hydrolase family 43 protein n=1 Tax=Streptomyces sp. NBC_01016 TaxID=2903720 RepID=UPI002254AF78|nr:glycoside hydrolase family 43 protein [Streptomyces sp. NBC_01016]MCX4834343.1 glycoside hydrolase family 43 protein [Streptomyces sp. NBC_01016]
MHLPTRPVISGFHPDPTICRVDGTYYMAHSSFEYAPGVPLYRSADLRTWEHIGHALDRPSQLSLTGAAASGGIFAPTLRHHDGLFWLITTNLTDGGGHLLVTAQDPAGPWSDPVRFPDAPGIDPDLAWDRDGTCYLTWSGFDDHGPMGLVQAEVDPTTGKVLSEPRQLWQGTGGKFPEGPHLYRIGDFWYQLIAEGGTERGHSITIARASSPAGPFEPCPWNPILTARGTDSPVQNAGHGDLVERPDGQWALVYHGVRTRGTSPEWHVLGRETFASRITWEDGWPQVGEPVEAAYPAIVNEELSGTILPPSWAAPGRFPDELLKPAENGWRLTPADSGEAVFVGRRQEHLYARIRAEVRVEDGEGGLELRIDPRHAVRLEVAGGQVRAVARIGSLESLLGETNIDGQTDLTLTLRIEPADGHIFSTELGPDKLVATVTGRDGTTEIGRVDGRYFSTEVAGGMTGRLIGLFCDRGDLIVRSFTYTGSDDPDALDRDG